MHKNVGNFEFSIENVWFFLFELIFCGEPSFRTQIFRSFHGLEVMKNVMRNEHTPHEISHTN